MQKSAWHLRVGRQLQLMGTALLDLLYPPLCLGCDAPVPEAVSPLCHRCLQRLERADTAAVAERLARLPAAAHVLDGAACLWVFDKGGTLQRVQHALKYGNRPRYGVLLGRLMTTLLKEPPLAPTVPDFIVPVPLHRARFYERGYNQSASLAQGLAEDMVLPFRTDLLERIQATRSQTDLSREARWMNVRDAFALRQAAPVAGRRVLLVDDVLTTGATVAAAAQTLKQAGATAVSLAALALARG